MACSYFHNQSEAKVEATSIIIAQRERGQWTVYYSSSQSFILTFSYFLNNFDWLILKAIVQTFQLKILIYRRGNCVHQVWGCTLSYPFRFLIIVTV